MDNSYWVIKGQSCLWTPDFSGELMCFLSEHQSIRTYLQAAEDRPAPQTWRTCGLIKSQQRKLSLVCGKLDWSLIFNRKLKRRGDRGMHTNPAPETCKDVFALWDRYLNTKTFVNDGWGLILGLQLSMMDVYLKDISSFWISPAGKVPGAPPSSWGITDDFAGLNLYARMCFFKY